MSLDVRSRSNSYTDVLNSQDNKPVGNASKPEVKNISKVLKGLAIGAAVVLAVAATIAIVVGVIFMINPLGFGIGNAIGAGVTAGGAVIAAFAAKAAAFAGANALYITIAGAAALGATGVGSALFVIIKRVRSKSNESAQLRKSAGSAEGSLSKTEEEVKKDQPLLVHSSSDSDKSKDE